MDYREELFRQKFSGAAECLSARPEQVVSLKLRENVNSPEEYRQLVETLQDEAGLQCSRIEADLQGRGYLVSDGKTKIIIVEHETGLELLYIAGSIASLIGLVPLVLQGWRALRGYSVRRRGMLDQGIEIRRFDGSGGLQEEHIHGRHLGSFSAVGSIVPTLSATAGLIEQEIRLLSQQIERLGLRVDALEEQHRAGITSSAQMRKGPKKAGSRKKDVKRKKP